MKKCLIKLISVSVFVLLAQLKALSADVPAISPDLAMKIHTQVTNDLAASVKMPDNVRNGDVYKKIRRMETPRSSLRFDADESLIWHSSSPHILQVLNISTGGLGVLTDGYLQVDEKVQICLIYNNFEVFTNAVVVRKEERTNICGLKFLDLDNINKTRLLYLNMLIRRNQH